MTGRTGRWLLIAAAVVAVAGVASSAQTGGAPATVQAAPPVSPGLRLVAEGRFEEALPALDAELARSPDDPKLGLARAQCLMDLARWKEGLAAGQALLARFPGDADLRVMVGEALFESFRPLEAVETWRPLLQDPKEGGRALPRMLAGLLSQRRFEDGRKLVAEARGIVFDDTALSLAAQACGCPEKLGFLEELARRHPGEASLAENLKVETGVCAKGGTSSVAPPSFPDVVAPRPFHSGLSVLLNGKSSAGIGIDTGSQTAMLFSRRLAQKLGLTVLGGAAFVGLGDRGVRTSEKVLLDSLEFGHLRVNNLPLTLSPVEHSSGIIRMGLGPFLDVVVEWDRKRERYTFWPAGTPPEAIFGRAPDVTLPVLWFRGIPLVPVSIDGKGPYPFLFDTGASNTILTARFCPNLGLTPGTGEYVRTRGYGSSGQFPVGYANDVTLSLGGRDEALPWVQMTDIPQRFSGPVYGFLGRDIVFDYRVIFDGPRCRIHMLRYPGGRYRDPMLNRPPPNLTRERENPMPPPSPTPNPAKKAGSR